MGFPDLGTHHLAKAQKDGGTLLVDTSAFSQNADTTVTLTYTLNAPKSWESVDVQVAFSSDNWFTLARDSAETTYQFRPRDAREPAVAQCTGHDPATGHSYQEDCTPAFKLYWSAPVSFFGNNTAYQPLPLRATFTLELPTLTLARTSWLTGTSTNYNGDPTGVASPDYSFDQGINPGFNPAQNGGLSITSGNVTTAAGAIPVVVTSQDYGGSANLRAKVIVTYNGTEYPSDVPVADPTVPINTGVRGTWSPACGGVSSFIPLPVDQDCNGIADWWEGQYTTPVGGHLDPTADNEPGYAPDSPKGDGWSVHDEYRGFHYIPDDSSAPKWTSTNPVKTFDIFFWGAGFQAPNRPFGSGLPDDLPTDASVYPEALRRILCLQGSYDQMGANTEFGPTYPDHYTIGIPNVPAALAANSMLGYNYCSGRINEYDPTQGPGSAANPLKFWYRRVSATQANTESFADPPDPHEGVDWFNKNSLTSASTQGNHTVVVYFYEPHSRSTNQTRLDLGATTNNLASCPDCTDPHRARIGFDFDAIARQARSDAHRGTTTMSPMTLAAEIIAHETGHWFQQNHAARPGCCTFVSGGQPSSLNWTTYTTDSQGRVLVGIEAYPNDSRQLTPVDQLECGFSPGPQESPIRVVKNLPGAPDMRVYTLGAPQLDPSVHGIIVNYLQYELMDWTPNMTLADRTQWHFDPSNLKALCVMNPCPVPGKTLCNYGQR
jgi:hypothetical protein